MAISKATGREYESRREKGYKADKWAYRVARYPKGFDRWGQPNTCGIVDPTTGKECPEPNVESCVRCELHQELHEEELSRRSRRNRQGGRQ